MPNSYFGLGMRVISWFFLIIYTYFSLFICVFDDIFISFIQYWQLSLNVSVFHFIFRFIHFIMHYKHLIILFFQSLSFDFENRIRAADGSSVHMHFLYFYLSFAFYTSQQHRIFFIHFLVLVFSVCVFLLHDRQLCAKNGV